MYIWCPACTNDSLSHVYAPKCTRVHVLYVNKCKHARKHALTHASTHAKRTHAKVLFFLEFYSVTDIFFLIAGCYLKICISYKGNLFVFNAIEIHLLYRKFTYFSERSVIRYYVVVFLDTSLDNCIFWIAFCWKANRDSLDNNSNIIIIIIVVRSMVGVLFIALLSPRSYTYSRSNYLHRFVIYVSHNLSRSVSDCAM